VEDWAGWVAEVGRCCPMAAQADRTQIFDTVDQWVAGTPGQAASIAEWPARSDQVAIDRLSGERAARPV